MTVRPPAGCSTKLSHTPINGAGVVSRSRPGRLHDFAGPAGFRLLVLWIRGQLRLRRSRVERESPLWRVTGAALSSTRSRVPNIGAAPSASSSPASATNPAGTGLSEAFPGLVPRAVGVAGLEPATSWSQTRRAANCATPRRCGSRYYELGHDRLRFPRSVITLPDCQGPEPG